MWSPTFIRSNRCTTAQKKKHKTKKKHQKTKITNEERGNKARIKQCKTNYKLISKNEKQPQRKIGDENKTPTTLRNSNETDTHTYTHTHTHIHTHTHTLRDVSTRTNTSEFLGNNTCVSNT